jgi:hypothetical protein
MGESDHQRRAMIPARRRSILLSDFEIALETSECGERIGRPAI